MEKRYYADMMLKEMDARVIEPGADGRGPWAVLEETIFYPEGGGEPGDTGTLAGVRVTGTIKAEGRIRHYLERPIAPGPCRAVIDSPRRWRFMQHHTAQHLSTTCPRKPNNSEISVYQ